MAQVTIQDALEYCLANPDGLGVEELLGRFPEYQEELQPLLALSSQIGEVAPPPVPTERRAAMKARLMEAAAAQGQPAPVAATERVVVHERKPGWIWAILRRPAFAAAWIAAVLVAVVWWGAAAALPNSPFYNIKLASENIMLNFAGAVADKTNAHLGLASIRLDDVEVMNRQNQLAEAGGAVTNYQEHMNSGATLWKETTGDVREAIRARISAAVTRCEQTFKGFGANVAGLPESARTGIAQMYNSLSVIRGDIGESTYIDAPQGITVIIAPQPTPGAIAAPTPLVGTPWSVTPGVPGSPTGVALPSVSPGDGTQVVGTATGVVGTETPTVEAETATAVAETAVAGQTETPVGNASVTVAPGETRVSTVQPTSRPSVGTAVSKSTSTPKTEATPTPNKVITSPTMTAQPIGTIISNSTSTPGVVNTAISLLTSTATSTATLTPTRQADASPTRIPVATLTKGNPIPVPPQVTPDATARIPPINTLVPPTVAVEPTSAVCTLLIEELEIDSSCASGGDVSWSAQVQNEGASQQDGDWVAVLKVKGRSGLYQEAGRMSGRVTVQWNGSAQVEGSFRHSVTANVKGARVELTVTRTGARCNEISAKEKDCEG